MILLNDDGENLRRFAVSTHYVTDFAFQLPFHADDMEKKEISLYFGG
jgi:hypothetical protein